MAAPPSELPRSTHPTRRQFIHLTVIGGAALVWSPGCDNPGDATPMPPPTLLGPRFFSDAERLLLGTLADVVLPPDDQPGASQLGAVAYIEQLLTALEVDPPRLYAGGPFSDRNPQPLPDGTPSNVKPANDFASFLPLSRDQQLYWKLQLYGSDAVPGGGPNDATLGKTVGWRDLCRNGLAQLAKLAGDQPLDVDRAAELWSKLDPAFTDFLILRVLEACFGAPEYGGNKDLAGWKMIHWEGDVMPYGFAVYDEAAGRYHERDDAPVSRPNPGPDPEPLDQDTHNLLKLIVGALGGRMAP